MSFLSSTWLIAQKDLRTYLRDRMALLLGFLLPIVLITTFGFIMGNVGDNSGGMPKVTLWVTDHDNTETSRAFLDSLRESEMLRLRPSKDEATTDTDSIEQKVADGDASHVLVIQQGFAQAIQNNEDGSLRLIRDPGRGMEDRLIHFGIVQALYQVHAQDYWAVLLRKQFAEAGMPAPQLDQFTDQATEMSRVIRQWTDSTEVNPFANSDESPQGVFGRSTAVTHEDIVPPNRPKLVSFQIAQSVSGVSVMMLMFGLASCGIMLLVERDNGTMSRLLAAAVPRNSILLGKVVFAFVVGMAQMFVLLAYGELVFRIGILRDPFTLFVIATVWTLAATSFGMLIAAFSKTPKQAESLTPIVTLTFAALGGCWYPLQLIELPAVVDWISKCTPTYWAMVAFQGYFWNSLDLTSPKLAFALLVQLVFALVMMVATGVLFRRNFLRG